MTRIKVIGLGLNKTGTTTLGACLKVLGYNHFSPKPVARKGRPGVGGNARRDLLRLYRRGKVGCVLDQMDRHDSFEDWPYPLMYREIWAHFGDKARYILTTRITPETWLRSLEAHSLFAHPIRNSRKLAYGYRYPQLAPEKHLEIYAAHNADVRQFFSDVGRPDLLLDLCWERGDGWPELCGFLDLPVPDMPLPRSNVTARRAETGYEPWNRLAVRLLKAANGWVK